ncbi:MAG: ATP-binding protein [Bacteroidota bacterium]
MMMMIRRSIQDSVVSSMAKNPVTAILGPRQAGKTTLSKEIISAIPDSMYLDLEKPSDREMLTDPEQFFRVYNRRTICLDEIQLMPDIFSVMRSIIDDDEYKNSFLITGSASPELLRQSAETLAGRIAFYELTPVSLNELGAAFSLEAYSLRGGFPLSLLSESDAESYSWRENFVLTFLERDLRRFGLNIPPETLRRLWKMIAHINGQVLNYSQLSTALGHSDMTVRKYISILEGTYMLRILQPFHMNIKKRLIKSPKLYIRDAGIANALLNIRVFEELFSHPVYGSIWESICLESIIQKFDEWEPYYYRTSGGNELDLVLTRANSRIVVELKASTTPGVGRGFWQALEDINAERAYIIAPVKRAYPYKNNVWVLPLADFLKMEKPDEQMPYIG